jgi:hypothetical protein
MGEKETAVARIIGAIAIATAIDLPRIVSIAVMCTPTDPYCAMMTGRRLRDRQSCCGTITETSPPHRGSLSDKICPCSTESAAITGRRDCSWALATAVSQRCGIPKWRWILRFNLDPFLILPSFKS